MDALDAALRQLAEHSERLGVLDSREAQHFDGMGERLAELGGLITGLSATIQDQDVALAALQRLDEQVAALTARFAELLPADAGEEARAYQPAPPPRWWKLHGQARDEAVAKLRAWVDQVYQPGYGHLAAALGPCWPQHPLCLYGLDILSDLWSVLYLQGRRTPGMLSAQAEYQTRILPALAEQLVLETTRCGHAQERRSLNGHARSAS